MVKSDSLVVGAALLAAALLSPSVAWAADLIGRDQIIAKLRPAPSGETTRSLAVVPSISLDVKFEFDSARLTDEARRQVDELGAALASDTLGPYRFELAGHTDVVGTAEYNQKLSERRSAAVKDYLVQQFKIAPNRLSTVGWGFQKLQNPQDPQAAENRRVEIANLGKS
jgi:outer membrane protein OmpA-like peptidoglycan-associated protein